MTEAPASLQWVGYIVTLIIGALGALGSARLTRRQAEKESANAASQLTDAALKIEERTRLQIEEMETRLGRDITKLKKKTESQDREIASQREINNQLNGRIQRHRDLLGKLTLGVRLLIEQIEVAGGKPGFIMDPEMSSQIKDLIAD